ncbi:MAG: class I SAM-dependent methyltransferase [Myxococcaceae bacterium]
MDRPLIAVTSCANPEAADVAEAEAVAARWRVPYLARPIRGGLSTLFEAAQTLLVVERSGVSLHDSEGGARWSWGLAALRLQALDAGKQGEALVRVGALASGERVLDCTLGLAQDARVAARLVGPRGKLVGLEASLPLAMLAAEGLSREPQESRSAEIEVHHMDCRAHLARLPPGSFDVVLFDPMFSRERRAQPSFALLRRLASPARLDAPTLAEARRVARRAVLVKAPRYGPELKALGLVPEASSRSAPVVWAKVASVSSR